MMPRSWIGGLLSLLFTSCTALSPLPGPPSPLPSLETLPLAARAQVLQARIARVQTLTAVLAVSYTLGKQRGTFDMVVNYAAPDALRFTALKDTLLSIQMPFDVLLTGDRYRFMTRDEAGEQVHQGAVEDFARAYPTFRTFFIIGEAFFLPAVDAQARPPDITRAGTRLTTRLRSAAQAHWRARPDTLEITQACLLWQAQAETVLVRVQYQDYRPVEAYYLPHRVTVTDRRLGFTAQSVVKYVELNTPLAPGVFDITP